MNISKIRKICRSCGAISIANIAGQDQFIGAPYAVYRSCGVRWASEQLCELFGFDRALLDETMRPPAFVCSSSLVHGVNLGDCMAFRTDASFTWCDCEYVVYDSTPSPLVVQKQLLDPVADIVKVEAVREGKLILADERGSVYGIVLPVPAEQVAEMLGPVEEMAAMLSVISSRPAEDSDQPAADVEAEDEQ